MKEKSCYESKRTEEVVESVPLSALCPFKGHPFLVKDNWEMDRLEESIQEIGTITPALARPLKDGKYELISGHRRFAACKALGMDTMPIIVREMSDDEAVIAMVDANLQRESILPSEKAYAYKMKLEALTHQGKTLGQTGPKRSREAIALNSPDSGRQIQRFIRLTNLIPGLLSMVDNGRIAFLPAVEISFLKEKEQKVLLEAIELNEATPSYAQALRLKNLSQNGEMTDEMINDIISEEKPNQKEQIKFQRKELEKYFPPSYSAEQIRKDIIKGLELLSQRRARRKDAR